MKLLGIILVGIVLYITGSMTNESYFVNPLGATMWFGFVALLAAWFLLIAFEGISCDYKGQKIRKLKALADKERFYMTDFQARRGKWADQ